MNYIYYEDWFESGIAYINDLLNPPLQVVSCLKNWFWTLIFLGMTGESLIFDELYSHFVASGFELNKC